MSDFVNYLQHRIEEAKRKLQEANDRIQQAVAEREMLTADLQGYERTLAAELRDQGIKVSPQPVQMPLSDPGGDDNETGGVNKAEFARQFVRKHGATGVTPNDIFQGFVDAEIPIKKPYIYALVQRLQKQNAIRPRRGKWYPVLESDQSLNGTVDGLLP